MKVKDGSSLDTDTLSVKGWFAMGAEPGTINSMAIDLDGQIFTIPGNAFVYKLIDDKIRSVQCKKVDTGGGLANIKFDMVKCMFSLQLSKAQLETVSGLVDLTLTIDMDTGVFEQTVNIDLQ